MSTTEKLIIVLLIGIVFLGFWVLYLDYKINKNELLIKALINIERTNVELIGAVQDRMERLEKRGEGFRTEPRLELLNIF